MKLILKLLLSIILAASTIYASEAVPTKSEVAKLYVATFNRAPDSAGLDYWVNTSGLPLSGIAKSFFDAPETQALYPAGTSNRNFVKSVYQNLFNRTPDSAGWDYWESELNAGNFTKNRFMEAVINGALDTKTSSDATILDNKNEVGIAFADAGLNDVNEAKFIMQGITSNSSTVDFITNIITTGNEVLSDIWSNYTGGIKIINSSIYYNSLLSNFHVTGCARYNNGTIASGVSLSVESIINLMSQPVTTDGDGCFDTYLVQGSNTSYGLYSIAIKHENEIIHQIIAQNEFSEESYTPINLTNFHLNTDTAVLFVHGLNSNFTSWGKAAGSFAKALGDTNYVAIKYSNGLYQTKLIDVSSSLLSDSLTSMTSSDLSAQKIFAMSFSNNVNLTFDQQGEEVNQVIEKIKSLTGKSKIILIGHSMGGLASRAYIQNTSGASDTVVQLITVGTPHNGVPVGAGKVLSVFTPLLSPYSVYLIDKTIDTSVAAFKYLETTNSEMINLNSYSSYDYTNIDTHALIFSGIQYSGLDSLTQALNWGDGIVPETSQKPPYDAKTYLYWSDVSKKIEIPTSNIVDIVFNLPSIALSSNGYSPISSNYDEVNYVQGGAINHFKTFGGFFQTETKSDVVIKKLAEIVNTLPYSITYSWEISEWGICTGNCGTNQGTQTRTVQCKSSSGNIVSDGYCDGEKEATTQNCTVSICANVDETKFAICYAGNTEANYIFYASNSIGGFITINTGNIDSSGNCVYHQTYGTCSSSSSSILSFHETGDSNNIEVSFSLNIGSSAEFICTETIDGIEYQDSLTLKVLPLISSTTYSWETGTCSDACGTNNATRTVTCKSSTGSIVSDSYCSAVSKPSESCTASQCIVKNIIAKYENYENKFIKIGVYAGWSFIPNWEITYDDGSKMALPNGTLFSVVDESILSLSTDGHNLAGIECGSTDVIITLPDGQNIKTNIIIDEGGGHYDANGVFSIMFGASYTNNPCATNSSTIDNNLNAI